MFLAVEVLVREDERQIRRQYTEELHKLHKKDILHLAKKLNIIYI